MGICVGESGVRASERKYSLEEIIPLLQSGKSFQYVVRMRPFEGKRGEDAPRILNLESAANYPLGSLLNKEFTLVSRQLSDLKELCELDVAMYRGEHYYREANTSQWRRKSSGEFLIMCKETLDVANWSYVD